MAEAGRWLMLAGIVLAVAGAAMWFLGKSGFRGLPGDIRVEGERVRFYFPIVTCLALSAILTLLLWLVQWLRRR